MNKIFEELTQGKIAKVLVSILVFAFCLGAVFFILIKENRVYLENSLVSAPITPLSPSTQSKLKNIFVVEGQKVKKGDALATAGSEIIRANTDGVIVETNRQIGALVNPQTPAVKMISLGEMRIDGVADENKGLNKIKVGQAASFTVDALPGKTFWGYVDEVAPTAKQTQISFSISSERPVQQFDVYVRFDAFNYPQIKNGMSAKMTIYTQMP